MLVALSVVPLVNVPEIVVREELVSRLKLLRLELLVYLPVNVKTLVVAGFVLKQHLMKIIRCLISKIINNLLDARPCKNFIRSFLSLK